MVTSHHEAEGDGTCRLKMTSLREGWESIWRFQVAQPESNYMGREGASIGARRSLRRAVEPLVRHGSLHRIFRSRLDILMDLTRR